MNENITKFLKRYIDNPNPCYAIMLNGKWGCGKSFFIKNWIDKYKIANKAKSDLGPIYVSLYGLKSTEQISRAIDREIHPLLYSKGANVVKKVLKVASKIAFKTTLSLSEDDKNDMSVEATFDPFSLLSSNKDEIDVGKKILIFDDIERCFVEMKLLLGYINNFVEHGGCHIILIGHETKATDDSKKVLTEFKEKTVGREFVVKPDVEAAVKCFLKGRSRVLQWMHKQTDLITDVFYATESENLRLLRQSLYSFRDVCSAFDKSCFSGLEQNVMKSLLASFIVVYCEYRGDKRETIKKIKVGFNPYLKNDKDGDDIHKLNTKYKYVNQKYGIDVLNADIVEHIVSEIETGDSINTFVNNKLEKEIRTKNSYDILLEFDKMNSDDFIRECKNLENDIKTNNIPNIYFWGQIISLLSYFSACGIYEMNNDVMQTIKEYFENTFNDVENNDSLETLKQNFNVGVNSYKESIENPLLREILDYANSIYEDKKAHLKNSMQIALENLSDENVKELVDLCEQTVPGEGGAYRNTSIFNDIEPDLLFNRICLLSNSGLYNLCTFFNHQYYLNSRFADKIDSYNNDLQVLKRLKQLLESEIKKRNGLDRHCLKSFIKYLDGAISRAEGYGGEIDI